MFWDSVTSPYIFTPPNHHPVTPHIPIPSIGKFVQNSQFWTDFGQVLDSFNMFKTCPKLYQILKTCLKPNTTHTQCWAIGQLDVLDICPKLCPKPVQNQNLFPLDRFWTDHVTIKLIQAKTITNSGKHYMK
jgi:hypothetical protein